MEIVRYFKLSDGSYGPVGRIYSLPLGDPKLESRYIASGKHRVEGNESLQWEDLGL